MIIQICYSAVEYVFPMLKMNNSSIYVRSFFSLRYLITCLINDLLSGQVQSIRLMVSSSPQKVQFWLCTYFIMYKSFLVGKIIV